jgi:hypothetical protein
VALVIFLSSFHVLHIFHGFMLHTPHFLPFLYDRIILDIDIEWDKQALCIVYFLYFLLPSAVNGQLTSATLSTKSIFKIIPQFSTTNILI